MFRPLHPARAPRRGVILLVVLSVITLFAIVGISFVLYAEAEAHASRLFREAEFRPEPDPDYLLAFFLGQLVYGTDNLHSALRGHSLAEAMYGFNDDPGATNDVPFSGVGRFRHTFTEPPLLRGQDNAGLINYTWYGEHGFVRDPERFGTRPRPEDAKGAYINGSVSYTYPDLNNVFLAAVRGGDGKVLIPSFHRGGFNGFGALGPANPNWYAPDPVLRYKTLRPRPADQLRAGEPWPPNRAYFPPPDDDGGDVKNLPGSAGGNDSVWIDLGFPVLTAPGGRKYKPLFAPLVVDLDNRVNLNANGNLRGVNGGLDWQDGRAGGHQGWGPWETNLEKVVSAREGSNFEARRLFIGNHDKPDRTRGRYEVGTSQFWGNDSFRVQPWRVDIGPFYSRTNTDGNPYDNADAFRLPGTAGWPATRCFPDYDGTYANGDVNTECRNNPLLFNFFDPDYATYEVHNRRPKDRIFSATNLEALLRYGDTGSPALTSDLFLLCPQSFQDAKTRRLVTTHSFDLNRPGVTPGLWMPADGRTYRLEPRTDFPAGPALRSPPLGAAPASGEFGRDWRALSANLRSRIYLNRNLPAYPAPDGTTFRIRAQDRARFDVAQQSRQRLAGELFDVLRQVTGAADPGAVPVNAPEFDALRWLAQLAANLVDYLDKDDYLTPFNWHTEPAPAAARHWVFGTELPRLVVNEVYAEVANDPADRGAGVTRAQRLYQVRFWVELHNPFSPDALLTENGTARLQVPADGASPTYAAYQLVVAAGPNEEALRFTPANVLGSPDPPRVKLVVADFTPEPAPAPQPTLDVNQRRFVLPSDGATTAPVGGNQGYFVVGPRDDFPGAANLTSLRVRDQVIDQRRSALVYDLALTADPAQPLPHTLLLRRLACPHLPPQPDPSQSNYNPYVTVDYLDEVATNDAVTVDANGRRTPTPVQQRRAVGRRQPYAAHRSQQRDQQPSPALSNQPQHTFFAVNAPREARFNWLVFMDRPVVNAAELLPVSAFKPHELTQQFMIDRNGDGSLQADERFLQRAPWFAPQARVYRLLEFLEGGFQMQGVTPNGPNLGRINLNNVWDQETFNALCDPRAHHHYTQADVDNVWRQLLKSRSPGYDPNTRAGGPGPNDRPFRGLAAAPVPASDPLYPAGLGVEDTFLRADPDSPARRLFEVRTARTNDHPYLQFELLSRLLGNVTPRSNVFAVFLTVGYFEVFDESDPTRPPLLGAEIGRSENRNVRHRMFAVVDRTCLTVSPTNPREAGARPFFLNTESAVDAPGQQTLTLPRVTGNYDDRPYSIERNARLAIDTGPNQEVIEVQNVSLAAETLTAAFTKRHDQGVALSNAGASTLLGNPGPQPLFDPRGDRYLGIVRYFSIIK